MIGRSTKQPPSFSHSPRATVSWELCTKPDKTDAEIRASPPENYRWPLGRIKGLKTIQQHLKPNNLCLNEARDMAQNRPLSRTMSTFSTSTLISA